MVREKTLMKRMLLASVMAGSISLLATKERLFAQASDSTTKTAGSIPATKAPTSTATKRSAVAPSVMPPNKAPVGAPTRHTPNPVSNAQSFITI